MENERDWLRRLLSDASGFRPAELPQELRTALKRLYDASDHKPGLLTQQQAAIESDTWGQHSPSGMRSPRPDDYIRHMLFNTQLIDISIIMYRRREQAIFDLAGTILVPSGLDPSYCSVELTCDEKTVMFVETNEKGEFRFREMSPGEYQLTIVGPGYEVTTPPFKL